VVFDSVRGERIGETCLLSWQIVIDDFSVIGDVAVFIGCHV
jgi:hypothetical protein